MPVLLLVFLSAIAVRARADEPAAEPKVTGPTAVEYTSFFNDKLKLHAWVGKDVAVLTETADLDPATMATIVTKLDKVYDYYRQATGREPHKVRRSMLDGRTTVAVVGHTCGAGCGRVGGTGIELMPDTFKTLYDGVKQRDQWDQVICYEFGRNFWFAGPQLEYRGDDNPRAVQTGYAVFMRFMAMEAAELEGGPFRERTFEQFQSAVEELVDLYEKDPSLTWANTLRQNRAPDNPMRLNGTDLFAGFCFRLRRMYGDPFVGRLWREAAGRPAAKTSQDALDNFVVAASLAAKTDLGPLFVEKWRWPVSDAARQLASKAGP